MELEIHDTGRMKIYYYSDKKDKCLGQIRYLSFAPEDEAINAVKQMASNIKQTANNEHGIGAAVIIGSKDMPGFHDFMLEHDNFYALIDYGVFKQHPETLPNLITRKSVERRGYNKYYPLLVNYINGLSAQTKKKAKYSNPYEGKDLIANQKTLDDMLSSGETPSSAYGKIHHNRKLGNAYIDQISLAAGESTAFDSRMRFQFYFQQNDKLAELTTFEFDALVECDLYPPPEAELKEDGSFPGSSAHYRYNTIKSSLIPKEMVVLDNSIFQLSDKAMDGRYHIRKISLPK